MVKRLALIAALLLPLIAEAQTYVTTDSALNTQSAASATYNATSHTTGINTVIGSNVWLLYTNPWGITSGSGTIAQAYTGSGSISYTMSLTGLPGGGVDAYPFILYGCDPYSDCYNGQPPQFPKQLSSMSTLTLDLAYALTGTITGRDTDLLYDEWVCNSATPSDSSQCLEIEILPYYSFVDFGGGTFVKTINEPAIINGTPSTFSFDLYNGGGNILCYPHTMPGMSSGELSFNLLDLLNAGVTAFGNSSYKYLAGLEIGTEFGASSSQSYELNITKLLVSQCLSGCTAAAPAAPQILLARHAVTSEQSQ
jgi:hypothetical protein